MPRCTGTTHGTRRPERAGLPCEAWAVKGASVCVVHGGAAPQVKAKAAARLVDAELSKLAADYRPEPIGDPLEALLDLAGRARAFMTLAERQMLRLDDLATKGDAGVEHARAVITVFQRSVDDLRKILRDIASLNLDERLARVAELKADVAVRLIAGALTRAGFDPDHALIATAVEAEIMALDAALVV